MPLFEQLKPLVLGPWVRALAIYIEIITFSLTLLAGGGVLDVVSFSVLGVVWITNIVLCARTRKAQKLSRYLDTHVELKPSSGAVVFDIITGIGFTISWGCYMYLARSPDQWFTAYSVFGAFVLIGNLSIAHIHLFMGSIAAHALRQQKNGQAAARRAHSREQSKHGADNVVELAQAPQATTVTIHA